MPTTLQFQRPLIVSTEMPLRIIMPNFSLQLIYGGRSILKALKSTAKAMGRAAKMSKEKAPTGINCQEYLWFAANMATSMDST